MKKLTCTLMFAALLGPAILAAADASADDLAVIVNKSNMTSNLTKSQLRKLVLAEQDSWPAGQKVTIVLRAPGAAERDTVLKYICRMTEDDYNQHSIHSSFSGGSGSAPKILGSAAAIRQYVASMPGAVAFLRLADVDPTVKVVSLDGAAAGQPEYKMKVGK
jgi:ABC-type phosphate transport system substrate-binding protein